MENRTTMCPICGKEGAIAHANYDRNAIVYSCTICGRYEIDINHKVNSNHFAPYLFYHSIRHETVYEYRYYSFLEKEICDKYNEEFEQGHNGHGRPIHIDEDIIESWYPKTFSERIDYILLYLESHISHVGQQVCASFSELCGLLFVDQKEIGADQFSEKWRRDEDCISEVRYMLNYLKGVSFIEYTDSIEEEGTILLRMTPEGYARVDELQKYSAYGRNALVAMKFGPETERLREAIRKGIIDAGYIAIFIDEVQHNNFITPELLKYIRDSKFVVVDLTHQNNGAYFEEGYAMGLGKPVIQLCQKDTKLHFDIAQMNTILWETEKDIPGRLCNRIKATIN